MATSRSRKSRCFCDNTKECNVESSINEGTKKSIGPFGILICNAICLFYKRDAKKLFASNVDEWAMVGCVYRYMWHLMQASEAMKDFDIDIEYNRMANRDHQECCEKTSESNDKELNALKAITRIAIEKWQIFNKYGDGFLNRMEGKKDNNSLILRPDVIVHRRGHNCSSNNNKLWAEFKKRGCKKTDAIFDEAKILFNTCRTEGSCHYQIGAMVMLREKFAHVGFFSNGALLHGIVVDSDICKEMSEKEVEQHLWCEPKIGNENIAESDSKESDESHNQ